MSQTILVNNDARTIKNPMLEKQKYVKLGKNKILEASPNIVHFGGYSLNRMHEQRLRIINISSKSQRLHIVNPTTPFFKVRFKKKGIIAPGMDEELFIEFRATDWRYYYDCIRVHSAWENLLVPIHAYPVMNDVIFPPRVDFGCCLLSRSSQPAPCSCSVECPYSSSTCCG